MMDVPWLNHLRRDRRGIYVPYINRWGPEDMDRYTVRDDATVRMPAVFCNDQDETVPDFTAQAPERQRWCMFHGWCQVCGRPVPWSRRYLVISSISVDEIDVDGRQRVVLTEPWLDERCARLAIERCPGLIRRQRGEDLSMLHVTSSRNVSLAVSTVWMDGPAAAATKEEPAAMWIKLMIPSGIVEVRR